MGALTPKKICFIILDGLGDRPVAELKGDTPLEFANTPHLDKLAREGMNGFLDPIDIGVCPGSDTSHLALLGYDPVKVYTGRGPFEAAGSGLDLIGGDIAFRCNWATIDENGMVQDRRAGRIKDGTEDLAQSIDGMQVEDVEVIVTAATEHRAALALRGEGLSPNITDGDPGKIEAMPIQPKPTDDSQNATKTARILWKVMEKAKQILATHPVNIERVKNGELPANMLLPRGPGMAPSFIPLPQLTGMKIGSVTGVSLINGICRLVGMTPIEVEGATGGVDTDLAAKAEGIIRGFEEGYDMVFCNIKMTDVLGHDKDTPGKVKAFERVDWMLSRLIEGLPSDLVLALTGDHATPVVVGDHTADPVPVLIWGGQETNLRRDSVERFSDNNTTLGILGRLNGNQLWSQILGFADRVDKFGA